MTEIDDDLVQCEGCSASCSHEAATSTDDGCYVCPACQADWQAAFDACQHEWRADTNSMGDPAQFCTKCFVMVNNHKFAELFPGRPISLEPYDPMSWLSNEEARPLGVPI